MNYIMYKQVYDLVFRARNAKLNSAAYTLEFGEWVRAGIAYNTRGYDLPTRKIAFFASIYEVMIQCQNCTEEEATAVVVSNSRLLSEAIHYYYEDILDVYQDHLRSVHYTHLVKKAQFQRERRSRVVPDFGNLIVLPSFDDFPALKSVFPTEVVDADTYECRDPSGFLNIIASTLVKKDSCLYRCASLVYDFSITDVKNIMLAEVKLWDSPALNS